MFRNTTRSAIIFLFVLVFAMAQEKCEVLTKCGDQHSLKWIDTNEIAEAQLRQYESKLDELARDLSQTKDVVQALTAGCSEHNCSEKAECVDQTRPYSCKCLPGYTGDGYTCTDINECSSPVCDANALCENIEGSFNCTCNSGYTGNGRSCIDIDECNGRNNCSRFASCRNTVGSYSCSCNTGYEGNGFSCSDQNECVGTNRCSHYATCRNTFGSYTCSCNNGFTGNGFACADVNECGSSNRCDRNARCTNTVGSYRCICESRFKGNGYSCKECYVGDGHSYRGYVSRTNSGRTCQYWSSQYPHEHSRTRSEYPSAGLERNYCRNPDAEDSPWCYTTDHDRRWEYCPVARC